MKLLKSLFVLFVAVSLVSCSSDDEGTPVYSINNANLSGTYNVTDLANEFIFSVIGSNGNPIVTETITLVTQSIVGAKITFLENGTLTAEGEIVVDITTAPNDGSAPTTVTDVIDFDGTTGTYTLNATAETITMISTGGEFEDGTYNIALFNETNVNFTQAAEEVNQGITSSYTSSLKLTRE